ncbi:TQO small subunit DoxD [Marinomonas spartinae]|uniref:TQO small subunit DoxD n=1 Tax=Marinomonas spartinae TaxID=1792290 RepID=UPI000808DDE2|nr:TQO small subunit DoxD [Marinomonas spartinae]SBS32451.1 TQO small subunit DoxD [Marinomonas spartinae]
MQVNQEKNDSNMLLSPIFWQIAGVMALAIRLVSGWIYWGGASRRLIYDPVKLDPTSHAYLANKLVHAAPGVAFDLTGVMHWLLAHGTLLHTAIIFFTLVELVVGVGLIIGFATRLMSFISIGLACTLMIIFGWMGTTCLDEWTMAALGFATASVTLITGGGKYAVDQLFQKHIENRSWACWLTSGPLPLSIGQLKKFSIVMGSLSILFTVGFYGYNYGAIVTPLGKRIDSAHHTITLFQATLKDSHLDVNTYINTGPDTQGAYITQVNLVQNGTILTSYQATQLKDPNIVTIKNPFAPWSSCKAMAFAVRCQLGSKATWSLALPKGIEVSATQPAYLQFINVEGKVFKTTVQQ